MTPNMGEIAALLTATCYSISSIFFTFAGRKFGPLVPNRLRLIVAILLLGVTHWIVFGNPFPLDAGIERWFWLAISGIVGLAIGDLFLFQAIYISRSEAWSFVPKFVTCPGVSPGMALLG